MAQHNTRSPVDLWDKVWEGRAYLSDQYHEKLVTTIQDHFGNVQSKRLLEIGAGSAVDSQRLAELGASVVSLDLSSAALRFALHGAVVRLVQLDLVQGDVFRLPFKTESFDAVYSQGVLEHFEIPLPCLNEQVRVLKNNGILLVDVPQKASLYTVRKSILIHLGRWFAGWETSYSLSQLESLISRCGLDIIDCYGSGYYPPFLLAFRNLHTFDRRHHLGVRLPNKIRLAIEHFWQRLEDRRWYYRWMWNIGVVGQKQNEKS